MARSVPDFWAWRTTTFKEECSRPGRICLRMFMFTSVVDKATAGAPAVKL